MKFFVILALVFSNFISAVVNPKKKIVIGPTISIDIGINGSGFDAQRRKICEDTGLIKGGYNGNQFVKSDAPSDFFEHDCSKYNDACTKRTKYTRGPLASMHTGIFIDMTKYFAIGTEIAAEWYRVKINYNQDIFLCTNPNCNILQPPYWADATPGSEEQTNFLTLSCKDRFQTDRYYPVNADDYAKYYNKFQYSIMLALKFYLNTSAYFKVAAGLSISHWKMPSYLSSQGTKHQYTRKNIFLKRGLACAAELGFFATNNVAIYLRYGLTTNRTKNKIFNYITQNVGLGAQWTFGR